MIYKNGKGWIMYDVNEFMYDPETNEQLAKIHMTTQFDPLTRSKQSRNEWVPGYFELRHAKLVDNIVEVESDIHKVFERERISKEFFITTEDCFMACIKHIPGEMYDPSKKYEFENDEEEKEEIEEIEEIEEFEYKKKRSYYTPRSLLTDEELVKQREKGRNYSKEWRDRQKQQLNV